MNCRNGGWSRVPVWLWGVTEVPWIVVAPVVGEAVEVGVRQRPHAQQLVELRQEVGDVHDRQHTLAVCQRQRPRQRHPCRRLQPCTDTASAMSLLGT